MILHISVITHISRWGSGPEQRICAVDVDFKLVPLRVAIVDVVILGDMSLYKHCCSEIPRGNTNPEAKLAATDMPQNYHPADAQESSFFKPLRVASRKTQREDF